MTIRKRCRYLFLFVLTSFFARELTAQRVTFSMAARLDATATVRNTALDHYAECNTYLIDGKPFYDAPSVIPFFANSIYRIKLDFVGFHDNNIITPGNYQNKGYHLKIKTRYGLQPARSLALDEEGDLPGVSLSTADPTTTEAGILLELYDANDQVVADASFPFEVLPLPDPSEAITTYLPFKYHLQQATLQVMDLSNTRNRITADITFGGTIAVEEGKEYMMAIMMEKSFLAGEKELSLSINGKQDYGHRVEFEWQGQALPLKLRTDNGMFAYLMVDPPVRPVTIVDIREADRVAIPPQPAKEKEAEKVVVSPQIRNKAKVVEATKIDNQAKAKSQPEMVARVKPAPTLKDVAVVQRFEKFRLRPPVRVEEVKEIELSAMERAVRKNPEMLRIKPIAPEISVQEAELAAEVPANTYTLLIHLINEFGEEDASPKPVTFVVFKK